MRVEFVKVLLRDTTTGWYYQGPSKWTASRGKALDLGQAAWAVERVFQEHLHDVEILLCYDDQRYDVVLPVERVQQSFENGEFDPDGESLAPGQEGSRKPARKRPLL